MALVGADFYFQEGAAVGVVFQAVHGSKLHSILRQQREEVKRRHATSQQTTLNIDGHTADALTTADNSVRSFYASQDDYHFVTNSLGLLKQFLAIKNGQGSLGRLAEFRYVPLSADRSGTVPRLDLPFRSVLPALGRVPTIGLN